MTDTGIAKTIRCEGCGRTLKPAALFCTACGTRRDVVPEPVEAPAPEPVAADTANCTSCGVALRPGAEFCTECGAKSVQGPINLTVEGASAATEAPPAPADRVSPAASRAILAPVSGGMGSYVGKSAPGSDAPPPPVLPGSGDAGDDHHRRNVAIVAVVAAVLLLIGGIAVLVATQHSGDGSLTAGEGSRQSVDGSFTTGHRSDSSSDDAQQLTALELKLAKLYEEKLEDKDKALSTYEAVLAHEPSHAGALEAVARLAEAKGDDARVAEVLALLLDGSANGDGAPARPASPRPALSRSS